MKIASKAPMFHKLVLQREQAGHLLPIPMQTSIVRAPNLDIEAAERYALMHDEKPRIGRYEVDRGLLESSMFSSFSRFGSIASHISWRLERDKTPLKILTIGPGQGFMEREIKDLFGERITIDTFSLTYGFDPANLSSVRYRYQGNIEYNKLPQGYDIVLSICGTHVASDQMFVMQQIFNSLNMNGEAYFIVDQPHLPPGMERDGPGDNHYRFRKLANGGIDYPCYIWELKDRGLFLALRTTLNISDIGVAVYLERGTGDDIEIRSLIDEVIEKPHPERSSLKFQITRGGKWFSDFYAHKAAIKSFINSWLKEKGYTLESRTDEVLEHLFECAKDECMYSLKPIENKFEDLLLLHNLEGIIESVIDW
ncbi:MAG: hypothetical protein HQ564_00910 [Candidatus Saganbacteria bacterium]|nr:hypothetical protein [Candidatus Saganbacteria bacterium]